MSWTPHTACVCTAFLCFLCALVHTETKKQFHLALCQVLTCLYSLCYQQATSNPRHSQPLLLKVMQIRRLDSDVNCLHLSISIYKLGGKKKNRELSWFYILLSHMLWNKKNTFVTNNFVTILGTTKKDGLCGVRPILMYPLHSFSHFSCLACRVMVMLFLYTLSSLLRCSQGMGKAACLR